MREVIRRLSRGALVVLAVATVGLSAWGYYGPGSELSGKKNPSPVDFFAATMGLFKIAPNQPEQPWALRVARYTGAVSTLLALAKVAAALGREQLRQFSLSRCRQHVVICGLGRKGRRFAQQFRALGRRVAAVDMILPGEDGQRSAGLLVELGDATQNAILEKLRVERARYVFAVCREDSANIDIAMETLSRFRVSGLPGPLTCYVHLFNLSLRVLLQRQELLRNRPAGFEMRLFNIHENTARVLLAEHPLENNVAGTQKRVHLVVIGLTHLGEAVVTQAARIAHYPSLLPARITVVDENAEAGGEHFLARQPGIVESCEFRLCQLRLTEPRFSRLEFLGDEAVDEERTLVLCLDDDAENVSLALRLAESTAGHEVPIFVRVAERRGLGRLLTSATDELAEKQIRTFGAIEEGCAWDALREEQIDTIAKALHAHYQATYGGLPDWAELSEDLRQANRAAADHFDIKLRAVNCERMSTNNGNTQAEAFRFTPEELELLSQMEHLRWSADRRLAGWKPGPEKDPVRKMHPSLIDWEELSEAERQKDREQVLFIPQVLQSGGWAIRRKAG